MTDALLIVAVIAAAATCPALMWWNARNGRAASCIPRRSTESPDLEAARRRQALLEARVAALRVDEPESAAIGSGEPSGDPRGG
jgi:hypothetical protein